MGSCENPLATLPILFLTLSLFFIGYRFTGKLSNTSGIVNLIVFCVLVIVLQGKQQIGPLFYKF